MAAEIRTRDGAPAVYFDISPSDTLSLQGLQWLRIGGAGDLCLKSFAGGPACTPFPVAAGEYVPFGSGYVMNAGTTATGILGIG